MMRNAFYMLVNFINSSEDEDVYHQAAKLILKNIRQIPNCTITDVASLCFASTATISRLCRKLDYESFSDFKKDVILNINYFNRDANGFDYDHQLPSVESFQTDNKKEIFANHFENIIQNLKSTYDSISYQDIEHIADIIYSSHEICFVGNYFTQSTSMQFQLELSYLGKICTGMYSVKQQKEIIQRLTDKDTIILSSISGSFMNDRKEVLRLIKQSPAYKICISQNDEFEYNDCFDMIVKVGNDHLSLIGKFSIVYFFEILEAIYHLKYANEIEKEG